MLSPPRMKKKTPSISRSRTAKNKLEKASRNTPLTGLGVDEAVFSGENNIPNLLLSKQFEKSHQLDVRI